ncbi:UDP-D-galactose:(glucosyl)LPS alpha-1,6-D-galactosyltransferase [Clostridium sp. DSM 8431]|uniref:glycosyltransferase n=1 Tax=Clostridium sp. DSM 8431 TaxID=1761781 RepID=UPI0008E20918|nr:glycosyltransferase [Clostridium sp. DSM 8431]SFU84210.1 UDP-D-galactose:(glucosyl)LPS alpha-1,6-D-galactosyltransferase [Clostridium sp. DSM 8431]
MIIDIVLAHADGRGGLEKVLILVSNELKKRGYKVRVIQVFESIHKEWKSEMDEFYSLKPYSKEFLVSDLIESYDDFIKENGKPDIIIATHVPLMSYACKQVVLKNNLDNILPVISWNHGPLLDYGFSECINFADAHLSISEGVAKTLKESVGEKAVYLINNPVEINNEIIPRDKSKLNIIYIGRLAKVKNIDLILRSFKNLDGNFEFNVYGDGDDKERLIDLSKEYNIEKNVIWHGWQENVWDNIKSASLLVLSSVSEGFGLVLIEALSRGIPVISSKTDGELSIVKEGVNGWLFDIGDSNKLSEILNNVQKGELQLPSYEDCISSVSKFSVEKVIDKFETSMLLEYDKKNKILDNNEILVAFQSIEEDKFIEESLKFLNALNEDKLRDFVIKGELLNYIPILNKVAILNYNNENYEKVIPYLKLAYEINPKDVETLYNISIVMYNIGEYREALNYLEQIDNKNNEIIELENILREKV